MKVYILIELQGSSITDEIEASVIPKMEKLSNYRLIFLWLSTSLD